MVDGVTELIERIDIALNPETADIVRRHTLSECRIALHALAQRNENIFKECKRAIVRARFGPPSHWGADRPEGWHLDRPCTPEEASMHDNGCNDALMAVATLNLEVGLFGRPRPF